MYNVRLPKKSLSNIKRAIALLIIALMATLYVVVELRHTPINIDNGSTGLSIDAPPQLTSLYSSISLHRFSPSKDSPTPGGNTNQGASGASPTPSPTLSSSRLGSPLVNIIAGDSQVKISWEPPSQIIFGTEVDQSLDAGNTWATVVKLPPNFTHEAVQGLTNGQNYWFRVRWILVDGTLGLPSPTMVSSPISNPAQPTGLTAIPSDGEIGLSWDPVNDSSITGYEVDESTDGELTWKVISANTGSSGSGYLATGLINGKSYTFRVKALAFGGGFSPYSSSVTAKTGAITPKGFALKYTIKSSQVTLSWEVPSTLPDVQTYQVNVSGDGGINWFPIANTAGGVTSAVVPYVIGGSSYQVIATSGEGATAASEIQLVETNSVADAPATANPTPSAGASGAPNPSTSTHPTPTISPQTTPAKSGGSLPVIPIAIALVVVIGIIVGVAKSRNSKGKKKPSKRRPPKKRKLVKKRTLPPKPTMGAVSKPVLPKKPKKKVKKKPVKKMKKKAVSEEIKIKQATKRKAVKEKAKKKRDKKKGKDSKKKQKKKDKKKGKKD